MTQLQIVSHHATVIPFFPDLDVPEDDLERTAQAIVMAYTDLMILIRQARTTDRCSQIHEAIVPLVSLLQTAESCALDKADGLC